MRNRPNPILFGAAYYHEYQPYERLKTDLDMMVEGSFSVIRVGESVWSTWEPENGRFDLDWLEPVLDGAHERGIGVVLGTPTYAVPPWLARLYPEIAGEVRTGERIGWGARQEADFTHPAFRFHAERVSRRILARYARHPAVIGFQVDNEPGLHLFHNRGVFERFVDHLRHTYGDVETLNREWGLVYWSHRLSTWADLWRPDGNAQPQYTLAWRRFQAEQTTEFIGWQADIAREYATEDQFVTTCISYPRPAVDDRALTERLDVTAGNPYYRMQDTFELPCKEGAADNWMTDGTWALYHSADRMFSSKQAPFLVTETNAQAIGTPWHNEPAYDGQWRQAGWALVSRGARMIEYWHWHTLHYGAETYWGGILPHSLKPGRTYEELSRLGSELRKAGVLIGDMTPDADVALLYSKPSQWGLAAQPQLALENGRADPRSYEGFVDPFYRGAFDAGLQTRIVHVEQLDEPEAFAARHPVLVASGLYVADDDTLDWLAAYAAAGGHLIVGPRTGYGDHESRARTDVKPGRLAEAAGLWYDEFANLDSAIEVRAAVDSPLELPEGAAATRWADGLRLDGAEPLVDYVHPHFGQFTAAATKAHGDGRVTYVGTVPSPTLAKALFDWVAPADPWRPLAPSVTATSGRTGDGRTVRFIHNWSWDEAGFELPAAMRDALTDAELGEGDELRLGPWDVRVLIEA